MNWSEHLAVMEQYAIKTDDMASEDAYFMATHMPFDRLEVFEGGRTTSTPKLMSEDDIFRNFVCNPNNEHRMIIVRGNNGTGKSHLIRYLKGKLERSSSTVYNPKTEQLVFLRRLNNSVRGAFGQLLEQDVIKDPGIADKIRKFVASSESKDETSFKTDILYSYIAAVSSDQTGKTYKPVECRDIASYLSDSRVREHLLREGGAISRCYSVITAPSSQVLKDNMIFTESDFAVKKILRDVVRRGDPQASDFATTLQNGDEDIQKLVDYLNGFTRDVVQRCADISSENTKSMFEQLRKDLKSQGKNLTIFIEDFTGFTGIDSELITVLSTEHGGAYDYLCRVTAFIGITDGYYNQFKDNFKDRVTHQISVTERSFGTESFLVPLTGRYLNAIYANRADILRWYNNGAHPGELPISEFVPPCEWETVGLADKTVTLYPFSAKAIMALYESLPDKNPRMFLRSVIRDELKQYFDGHIYDAGNFFPINPGFIQMANIAHSSAIDREESIPAEDRDRLKSVLAIWGDGSASALEKGGELFIGGVNRAFLADIGLGSYRGIGSAKREPSKEVPSVSDTYDLEPVSSSQKNITQKKPPVDQAARMYQRWKEDIDHWFSRKEPLKYHPDYRKEIRDFLIGTGQMAGAINWQDIGVPAYIASERLSNQSCICIEGQGDEPAKDKVLLSLDRSPESRDAILALMERRYAGSWDFEYSAYYQQRLITWLERVKPSLIRNVLGPIEEQKPCILQWCLTLQYIQALLYRNHIPDENPMELIRALFQPYENHSAAVSSTKEWSDMAVFLSNSSAQLDAARTLLRQSALTIMGAPQLAKDEKAKKVYRTRELVDATEGLISSHWDLEDSLPQSNPGNMMYNPADLLKKIYPRIHKVLHAEITQFHSAAEQLVELVGEISEQSLIDALSAVNEFLLECSASKLFVPEKLRLAFDIAPIERARTIFASYSNLKKADTAHFMDQLKIYSEKALVDLLEFVRNLSDIDTLAKQYEREACQELLKITQGVDLSALGVLAQSKLADLATQLEKLEVQDAD